MTPLGPVGDGTEGGGNGRVGVLVTAGVLGCLAVVAWLPTRVEPGSPTLRAGLESFLRHGPGPGVWRARDTWAVHLRAVAPHPSDPEQVLSAVVDEAGRAPAADGRLRVHASPRSRMAWLASGAPADPFFRNYVASAPEPDRLADGTSAVRSTWRPRRDLGGETARIVWHDPGTGEVRRVEDRGWHGNLVHAIERLPATPPRLEVPGERKGAPWGRGPGFGGAPDAWRARDPSEAPFAVLDPEYVPGGYERLRSEYREWRPFGPPRPGARTTRSVTTTWSDGLAILTLVVAPAEDMDAIQEMVRRMRERASRGAEPDPAVGDGCPTLPEGGEDLTEGTLLIRRRMDACRTVLRVDGLEGVSAVLVANNELPGDEYVKVVRSLRRTDVASRGE